MDIQTNSIEVARLLLAWKMAFNVFGAQDRFNTSEELAEHVHKLSEILKNGNDVLVEGLGKETLGFNPTTQADLS